jgi:ABC-2 type transport system permease protein
MVNWRGVATLYEKEVRRFVKVAGQTVVAPTVSALLLLAVFSVALGGSLRTSGDLPYLAFLAPGLIMMAMIQNAFANTSGSIIVSKVQGNVVDILMPPLSPSELTAAITLGGVTRGLAVGVAVALAMMPFSPVGIVHPWAVAYFAAAGTLMLAALGTLTGIWAERFDQTAVVTNFVVTPLAFLSGTFYSIQRLPEKWQAASQFNPIFFAIDGFRYGMTGVSDGHVVAGGVALGVADLVLLAACRWMFARGYRLKA